MNNPTKLRSNGSQDRFQIASVSIKQFDSSSSNSRFDQNLLCTFKCLRASSNINSKKTTLVEIGSQIPFCVPARLPSCVLNRPFTWKQSSQTNERTSKSDQKVDVIEFKLTTTSSRHMLICFASHATFFPFALPSLVSIITPWCLRIHDSRNDKHWDVLRRKRQFFLVSRQFEAFWTWHLTVVLMCADKTLNRIFTTSCWHKNQFANSRSTCDFKYFIFQCDAGAGGNIFSVSYDRLEARGLTLHNATIIYWHTNRRQ